jgi:hypothetical protein
LDLKQVRDIPLEHEPEQIVDKPALRGGDKTELKKIPSHAISMGINFIKCQECSFSNWLANSTGLTRPLNF